MRKVLFLSLLVVALTGFASANSVTLTFSTFSAGSGGVLTPTSGTNIPLGRVNITNGGSNNFNLSSADLNFDLGTDTLTIFGEVTSLGINSVSELFSATLNPADVSVNGCSGGSSCVWTFSPAEAGTVGSALISADSVLKNMSWTFTGSTQSPTMHSPYAANSTTITVTGTPLPTPEPASLLLLSSGLAIGFARRKLLNL